MSERERVSLLKKIDIAHFVAFEEMAFTKYKKLVKLEDRHGVTLGEAYGGDDACKNFVRAINGAVKDKLKGKLDRVKFIGIMADGSTDAAVKDQEAIFAFYIEEGVKVVTKFIGMIDGEPAEPDDDNLDDDDAIDSTFDNAFDWDEE